MSEKSEMNGTKCNKNGWVKKKLGEVCSSDLGKTLNKSKDTGELFPYLCAVNILWDKIDLSNLKETKFKSSEIDRYTVKKGDLLICEGGDIGRSAIWNKDETILYQNALHRVRFNDEINPRFCLLYLFYLKKKGILDHTYGKGVTIKHLVKSALLSIPIPVAPLSEQQRIVSELDCLNGIIEKQKEQLKQLDELAQSIFYDMFGDPVENEKGWDIEQLNDLCTILGGGTPSKRNPEYWNGNIPWVSSKDMKTNYINASQLYITKEGLNNSTTKLIPIGSLLLVNRSGILKHTLPVAINKVEVTINQDIKAFIPNNKVVNTFLMYNLKSYESFLLSQVRAVTADNIELSVIKGLTIPVPPLPLQQAFAQKIEAIEHQKELIKQSLAETENLFNSRMDYYFG